MATERARDWDGVQEGAEATLAAEVRARWAERDLLELASAATRHLSAGTATDWGLAAAADSAIPPIALSGGIPDPTTLPRLELLAAMERALAVEDDGPLRYGGALGYDPLRDQLAERYSRDRGLEVDGSWFMLTNGSAGAIDLVCKALITPGDVVISEAPTFSGTLRTFRGHEAEIVSVGMDGEGIRTDEVAAAIRDAEARGKRVKLIYTIANFHNPTGAAMSEPRREELLRLASAHGAFVVDDDAYGELYFGERAPLALSALGGGHGVITVGSFSKVIATGLRVGWIHAHPNLIDVFARMRFDMGNSPLLHRTLAEYLGSGALDRQVRALRPLYARKMDVLCSALTEYAEPYATFVRPAGGFFLWVRLGEGLTADAVQQAAVLEGVSFPIGYAFFADRLDPTGEHVRLAYSWTAEDDLREGARRFARACERAAEAAG